MPVLKMPVLKNAGNLLKNVSNGKWQYWVLLVENELLFFLFTLFFMLGGLLYHSQIIQTTKKLLNISYPKKSDMPKKEAS